MWFFGRRKEDPVKPVAGPAVQPEQAQAMERTHLGKGISLTGDLRSSGDVALAGAMEGTVDGRDFHLAQGARFKGTVRAANAEIHGEMAGTLSVKIQTRVHSSARLEGEITTGALEIAPSAHVDGKVTAAGSRAR